MKEFITEYEEVAEEDDKAARIAKRVADGMSQQDAEAAEIELFIPFKIDGKELHAYHPLPGQLAFMMAALGRGQTQDQRFAAIINIMLSCLRDEDADYFESRLLTRDPKKMMPLGQVEGIFEFLAEEWFARPTQPASGSVASQPSAGENSPATTTPSDPGNSSDSDHTGT